MHPKNTEIPQIRRVIWYLPLICNLPFALLFFGCGILNIVLLYRFEAELETIFGKDPAGWALLALILAWGIELIVLPCLAGPLISYALLRHKLGLSTKEAKDALIHTKYPDTWTRLKPCYRRNRLLAFNFPCVDYLRPWLKFTLNAIPATLAMTALVAWSYASDHLAIELGLKALHSSKHAEGFDAAGGIFLLLMIPASACGWCSGWMLNVLYSRYVLRWPWPKIRLVYWLSEVPREWLNLEQLADPEAYAAQRPIRDLEAMLGVGRRRYIATRGTLLSGLGLFIATYLPLSITYNAYLWTYAVACAIPCAIMGHFLGRFYWWNIQRRHRKLTTGREAK